MNVLCPHGTSHTSNSGSETYSYANGQLVSNDVSETWSQSGQSNPTQTVTTSNNDQAVSVDPTTGLVTTTSKVASSTDTTSSQDVFTSSVLHTASLTNARTDVTSGTDTSTGTEQASDTYRNTVTLVGLLPTGETVNITNVYVQANDSQNGFIIASVRTPDGTVTNTNSITGTFNIPTIYDAQYGTVTTTDPTTGIMTTTTSVNVIDGKSTDSVANVNTSVIVATGSATDTQANSDSGTLQQAWSLTTITSQTNAAGQPIGTVTTTSDVGFATETKLNGVITDPGLTNTHTSTTTAAGSAATATLPIPNPGDLFTGQQAGGGSTPPAGSSQQPANQQATNAQQAAQTLQTGAQKGNENAANAPGGAAGGNAPNGAAGAQKALAGAAPGNQNVNAAVQKAGPANPNVGNAQPNAMASQQLQQAQMQTLTAQYGQLRYIGPTSLPGARGAGRAVLYDLYRTADGVYLYVDRRTSRVVCISSPNDGKGPQSPGYFYFLRNPSKMDPNLQRVRSATLGVAAGAVTTAAAIVIVPIVAGGAVVGLTYVGVSEAIATGVVNSGIIIIGVKGAVGAASETYRAAAAGDWNTVAFNGGCIVGGLFVIKVGGTTYLIPRNSNSGDLIQVTSWAPAGVKPDLNSGRWVQLGGPTTANFLKTGLWGGKFYVSQQFPYVIWTGSNVPFSNYISGFIKQSRLMWPNGWEFFKGILQQRRIK